MKKLLLGLILVLGLTTTSCGFKDDIEGLQAQVDQLKSTVMTTNTSTLALIAELKDQIAAVIQQASNGIAVTIEEAVAAQNTSKPIVGTSGRGVSGIYCRVADTQ